MTGVNIMVTKSTGNKCRGSERKEKRSRGKEGSR